jgi:dihydropyrimidinase
MSLLVRNGTLVTALDERRADVRCDDGKIVAVGPDLEKRSGDEVVDASGQFVFPGGVDPHVHMALPFMGTVSMDDFETGGAAGLAGGTTTFIDFVIPGRGDDMLKVLEAWREKSRIATADYTYHMAVTWWSDRQEEHLAKCVEQGITSIKVFLAYRGAIGIDDTELIHAMTAAAKLGMVVTVHAEHGEMIVELQNRLAAEGKTGPRWHEPSRPAAVEGEATNRVLMLAELCGAVPYIVHMTCREAVKALAEARERGQKCFGETCPQYLLLDDSVYRLPGFDSAKYVMSPPIRPAGHSPVLWSALQSGILQTVGTDHITFSRQQKEMGKDDFRMIPNGAGGIQDRLSLLWHHGVRTGRLDRQQFVDLVSTRAARIFDLYPRKGSITAGADADLVVWDPEGTRTISAKTQFHRNDESIFEGFRVTGVPSTVIAGGRIRYRDGDLRAERGSGRFLARTPGTAKLTGRSAS